MSSQLLLVPVGLLLMVVGLIMTITALLFLSRSHKSKANVRGGGIIMIGPIPIIFGTDKDSAKILIILAIILVASLIILYLV